MWARPEVPVDPESIAVRQLCFESKDGTPVSMFLVHRKGLERNGENPTLLSGYGGFNIAMLLWVIRDAGHRRGKPLELKVGDVADQRIFMMWQLGMLNR